MGRKENNYQVSFKKKAELTMNLIVMAALALIALAILMFMLTDKIGDANKGFSACENKGGTCTPLGVCEHTYQGTVTDFECTSGQECCISACARRGGTCVNKDLCVGEQIYFAGCGEGNVCCKL